MPTADHRLASDADYFLELQTRTGWGKVLTRFVDWIQPPAGALALDVGTGPGLLTALLARAGCRAIGVDLSPEMFHPKPLHPQVALADAQTLPFPVACFDLVTASNLLFLLPEPLSVLREIARVLRPGGQVTLLNPAENLSEAAALELADQRNLQGLARETLINWGRRAEAHHRWTEDQLRNLFAAARLDFKESTTIMGPGFARLARGVQTIQEGRL